VKRDLGHYVALYRLLEENILLIRCDESIDNYNEENLELKPNSFK
jgi:hypothetical protein